jgi:hypothetical protein
MDLLSNRSLATPIKSLSFLNGGTNPPPFTTGFFGYEGQIRQHEAGQLSLALFAPEVTPCNIVQFRARGRAYQRQWRRLVSFQPTLTKICSTETCWCHGMKPRYIPPSVLHASLEELLLENVGGTTAQLMTCGQNVKPNSIEPVYKLGRQA